MRYDDILDLPYPYPSKHKKMSLYDRAAQFAPFAALTGFEDQIDETGRYTEKRIEITEERRERLDAKLEKIMSGEDMPRVKVSYFVPDKDKEGGAYHIHKGIIKKTDPVERVLIFEDGKRIAFNDITDIDRDREFT